MMLAGVGLDGGLGDVQQRGEHVLVQVERGEDEDPGPFGGLADLAGRGDAVSATTGGGAGHSRG